MNDRDVIERFKKSEIKHGPSKFKKAMRLARMTPNDVFYWLELEEEAINFILAQTYLPAQISKEIVSCMSLGRVGAPVRTKGIFMRKALKKYCDQKTGINFIPEGRRK